MTTEEYLIGWCRGDMQIYYKTILWLILRIKNYER